jgi:glycosyltransferase involved in cell wall biosynthesis
MTLEDQHELLSFVTPTYNAASTVTDAITSVLGQEFDRPFEIVVVDDASTDDTGAVLRSLAEAHAEVINVTGNDRNLGAGATRNRAIARANGDLIYMFDADNVLPPDTVRPQLELMAATGRHCVSVSRLDLFSTSPDSVEGTWEMVHADGISGLRELMAHTRVPASHGNYLFTRELFDATGGYEEKRSGSDAWTFGMKHVARGFDVAVAPGTSYFHRLHSDSYWIREELRGSNDEQAVASLREMIDFFPAGMQEKIKLLRLGDPVFRYLDEGAFTPGGQLPGRSFRAAARMRRRLSLAARQRARREGS